MLIGGVLTWMQCVKRICGKMWLRAEIFCTPWGNKGFANLQFNLVPNNCSRSNEKMLLFTGKIGEA